MAINRYVDVNFDQPVSNYVPLPLEMLYKLGKDASKDYEDTLKGIEDSKGLLGKHKTKTSVKVYDPTKGGVTDAQIDFEPQRQAYQAKLQSEMESITNDYIKDKDTNKFKQRMSSLKNNAVAMNNDLAVKSAIIDKIDKHNEEIAKNKEFSKYGYLGDELLQYNTQFYNQYAKDPSKIGDYVGYDISQKVDRPKEVKETFGSLGEEILQSFASADGNGYLREKYREGRTKEKIDNVFNPWYENSNTKNEIQQEANYFFRSNGIKPDEVVETIKTKDGKTINITAYDKFESQKIAELANIARGYITSKGKDNISSDATYLAKWKEDLETKKAKDYQNTHSVGNPETISIEQMLKDNGLEGVIDKNGNPIAAPGEWGRSAGEITGWALYKTKKVADALGLKAPTEGPDKGNYRKLVYDHFVNLSKNASVTSDLHPSTGKALTEYYLGENSNISNTEIYPQGSRDKNDKATAEVVKVLSKNSTVSGIDYNAPKTGLKINYTPKNSDGNPTGPDEPYIMISKNQNFHADAEPMRKISYDYIDFNKNPLNYNVNKHIDLDSVTLNTLNSYTDERFKGSDVKLISTSTEFRKDEKTGKLKEIVRGVYRINGNPVVTGFEKEEDKVARWKDPMSLEAAQDEQTHYIETEGSLKQFNTKLQGTVPVK